MLGRLEGLSHPTIFCSVCCFQSLFFGITQWLLFDLQSDRFCALSLLKAMLLHLLFRDTNAVPVITITPNPVTLS